MNLYSNTELEANRLFKFVVFRCCLYGYNENENIEAEIQIDFC